MHSKAEKGAGGQRTLISNEIYHRLDIW
jgi:hypothetical protein